MTSGTFMSLRSPIRFRMFFSSPRSFSNAANNFSCENVVINELFSFLKYSLWLKVKLPGLILLRTKLERIFNFDNAIDHDRTT